MIRAIAVLIVLAAAPAASQDYAANSEARSWGLVGEEKARFEARVVDILCELTGDCPADCGAGARQLGVVRVDDERLFPVNKNVQPIFSGGVVDLLPYCGQVVEVDGLMVGDNPANPGKFYQVQLIRGAGEAEFSRTNRWSRVWADEHPEAAGDGPWFRRDPAINALIERDGYLGIGLEADREFIEEWFQ
ncbi:MAG: hypothetical protein AAFW69_04785 [Pseudomonadota bacterium]